MNKVTMRLLNNLIGYVGLAFGICLVALIGVDETSGEKLQDRTTLGSQDSITRPNVVMILVDDLGYGDLSSYGADDIQTPHIDQLAERGMKMTRFYANCPVCSPSRASLLTGRYPELVGVPGVIRTHAENSWGELADVPMLPALMRDAGYETALIGKWHLGLTEQHHPNQRGFDFFHGFLGDMMDDYYHHRRHGNNYMQRQTTTIEPEGHATDLFSAWACEWIEEQATTNDPFFLYLAYNAPHTPIQPPESWTNRVREREGSISDARAKLVALIEHMDSGIGDVIDCLEQNELTENTVVIFSSDNGGQLNVGANNGGLRDGKQSMYEGGLRVPTIVVWPNVVERQSTSDVAGITMDLFPTICSIGGVTIDHAIDGIDLLEVWKGEVEDSAERDLFFHRREGGERYGGMITHAIIRGDWKLLKNTPFEPYELYNLSDDPTETNDLLESHVQQRRALSAALRLQLQRGGAIPWQPNSRVND